MGGVQAGRAERTASPSSVHLPLSMPNQPEGAWSPTQCDMKRAERRSGSVSSPSASRSYWKHHSDSSALRQANIKTQACTSKGSRVRFAKAYCAPGAHGSLRYLRSAGVTSVSKSEESSPPPPPLSNQTGGGAGGAGRIGEHSCGERERRAMAEKGARAHVGAKSAPAPCRTQAKSRAARPRRPAIRLS